MVKATTVPPAKATGTKKPKLQKNPLGGAPMKRCASCQQTSHDVDRDAREGDKEMWVAWAKANWSASGVLTPTGEECYKCMDTRRHHFQKVPREELDEARRKCIQLDNKFCDLRRATVRGEGKYVQKAEVVDYKQFVESIEKVFDDRYEEGLFTELWAFARNRNLADRFQGNEGGLVEYLQESLGLTVTKDKAGIVGVEVLDHQAGSYRFRRGASSQVVKRKTETADGKEDANERFEMKKAKMASRVGSGLPSTRGFQQHGVPDGVHPENDDDDACDPPTPTLEPADEQCSESMKSGKPTGRQAKAISAVGSVLKSSEAAVSKTSGCSIGGTTQVSAARSSRDRWLDSDGGDGRADDIAEVDSQHSTAKQGKVRRSSSVAQLENAQDLLRKIEAEFSWHKHWESKSRRRDFDCFCSRLNLAARKLGGFADNEKAADMAQRLFAWAEELENRQAFIEKVRTNALEVVLSPLPEVGRGMLKAAPSATALTMVRQAQHQILSRSVLDEKSIRASCKIVRVADDEDIFGLSSVQDLSLGALCDTQQGGLVQLAEKVRRWGGLVLGATDQRDNRPTRQDRILWRFFTQPRSVTKPKAMSRLGELPGQWILRG